MIGNLSRAPRRESEWWLFLEGRSSVRWWRPTFHLYSWFPSPLPPPSLSPSSLRQPWVWTWRLCWSSRPSSSARWRACPQPLTSGWLTSGSFFANCCHSLKWFFSLQWSSSESLKWLAKNRWMKKKRTQTRKFQGMSIISMFSSLWVSKICLNIVYVWSSAQVFFFREGSVAHFCCGQLCYLHWIGANVSLQHLTRAAL